MSDDYMEYNRAIMTTLYNDLNANFKTLVAQGHDMETAAKALEAAWTGNSAYQGFHDVKLKWDDQYKDSVQILNRVAAAVEEALNRALGTDKKIGDGFAI